MSSITAAASPASAEIYDTDRFGELYYVSREPDQRNLGLAARFMISLFRRHNIAFALLGGWAIFLRGGTRSTQDVDFTVATTMDLLKEAMLPEQRRGQLVPRGKPVLTPEIHRLCIPQIHGATSIQVFVYTGGPWDPSVPHARLYTVSVDIIIGGTSSPSLHFVPQCMSRRIQVRPGYLNTPPDLPTGSEELRPVPETTQGRQPVPVIDLFYQLTTKLSAYSTRRETGGQNDYSDLDFLVRAYGL
ncbi:hypothetical protein AK830_g4440 [Neonectria ditissima]|uniref:Uncharacterized protein n=1 Tax=Neonectria ditissima TaxID=78410 RepID=A0A0N8H7M5_9HYPO|nr:hypothetical protein AK830_g4440 [Neonectria ditissima]